MEFMAIIMVYLAQCRDLNTLNFFLNTKNVKLL